MSELLYSWGKLVSRVELKTFLLNSILFLNENILKKHNFHFM